MIVRGPLGKSDLRNSAPNSGNGSKARKCRDLIVYMPDRDAPGMEELCSAASINRPFWVYIIIPPVHDRGVLHCVAANKSTDH